MTISNLMAISPLDGRYQEKLDTLRPIVSEYGLIRFRVLVEIRWLQQLAEKAKLPEIPALSHSAQSFLNSLFQNFSEKDAQEIKEIESTINHDVKAVEYFIKKRLMQNPELTKISEFIHFGCTSEDINNVAYALMLQSAREHCILPSLNELISTLKTLAHEHAAQPMLSRTHGQPATPTTVGKEIANVIARLQRQLDQLISAPILSKLNGATGNYNAFLAAYPSVNWPQVSQDFITRLGLTWNPYTTQIEPHDYIAEIFAILMRINTILIDFARDMWSYISLNYFKLKALSHEVGSSAMPHKVNPIDFENAEGNLGIANALLDHMALKLPISRWQRDLSDSTVLRNIGSALGYALLAYQALNKGMKKVSPDTAAIRADLNAHWEILAEPIQTILRRAGIDKPYEKLKEMTRGQTITKEILHQFIQKLDLPAQTKEQLLALTPDNYLGYAEELARKI